MSIYNQFTDDDLVSANPTVVTTGLWSGDTGSLASTLWLGTAAGQQVPISGEYYLDVFDKRPDTDPTAEVQFSVTYGHINGGGSPTLDDNDLSTLSTQAIYSQYRNLLLDPSDTKFTFNNVESDHIFVINFQRSRIREQLDPGNWELPLSGTKGISTFIDDSGQTLGALTANSKAGRVFNVVSGALDILTGSVVHSSGSTNGGGYGLIYPDLGIIVLNPNAIGPTVGFVATGSSNEGSGSANITVTTPFYSSTDFNTGTTSVTAVYAPVTHSAVVWGTKKSAYNHTALFNSIKGATAATGTPSGSAFKARSAETISSTHYFVRLRNKEFNYSNNPTFYNPDTGVLTNPDFRNDPRVYVTTVGLYNSQNELLAVAKLSKPVRKSFDEEVLLRVRLDF
jgi:hypothetical protein